MAPQQQTDVQLLIQAKDEASKTLAAISAATAEYVSKTKSAAEESLRTDQTLKQLNAEYTRLKQTIDGLRHSASMADEFKKASDAMATAETAAAAATAELTKQQAAQQALAAEVKKTTAVVGESSAVLSTHKDRLAELRAEESRIASASPLVAKYNEQRKVLAELRIEYEKYKETARQSISTSSSDAETARIINFGKRLKSSLISTQQTVGELGASLREYGVNMATVSRGEQVLALQAGKAQAAITAEAGALAAAQEKHKELSAELQKLNSAYRAQERATSSAQSAVERTTSALEKQRPILSEISQQTKAAGIDINNIASEQNRLRGAINDTSTAVSRAGDQMQQYRRALIQTAKAEEKAAHSASIWEDNSRKAMSVVQRARGELLSLAAAYIGLYGAIHNTSLALDAYNQRQQHISRLHVVYGDDQRKIGDDLKYVREMADKLGQPLMTLEDSYTRFAVSSHLAGQSVEATKFIFNGVATAAAANHMSAVDLQGTFVALEQIMGKGTIQAQDFKEQIGNRLPGAMGILASAMHKTYGEVQKDMAAGQISSAWLIPFADELEKKFGKALPKATHTLQAEFHRLISTMQDLGVKFGDTAAPGLTKPIEDLKTSVSSPEFEHGVETIAHGLIMLGKAAAWAVAHADELKWVLGALVTLKTGQAIFGLYTEVGKFTGAMAEATVAVLKFLKLEGAVGILAEFRAALTMTAAELVALEGAAAAAWISVGILIAGIAGWEIGTSLYKNNETVRTWSTDFVAMFMYTFHEVIRGAQNMWDDFQILMLKNLPHFMPSIEKGLNNTYASLAGAAGLTSVADYYKKNAQASGASVDTRIAALQRQKEARNKATSQELDDLTNLLNADGWGPGGAPGSTTHGKAPAVNDPYRKPAMKKFQEEMIAGQRKALSSQMAADDDALMQATAKSLKDKLALISKQYEGEIAQARALATAPGATEKDKQLAAESIKKTQALVHALQQNEIEKWNKQRVASERGLQTKLAGIDKEIASHTAQTLDEKLAAIRVKYQSLIDELKKAGNKTGIAKVERLISVLQKEETQKYNSGLLTSSVQQANSLDTLRSTRIDTVNNLRKTGAISTDEKAQQKILDINKELVPQIKLAAQHAITLAKALGDKNTVANMKRLISTLDMTDVKVQSVSDVLKTQFADAASQAMGALAKGLANAAEGTGTLRDAFRGARDAFLTFAADFLLKIGEMIVQAEILQAFGLDSKGTTGSGATGAVASAVMSYVGTLFHDGGVVGQGGGTSRMTNPAWFNGAPRFHTGGIPGLHPSEVPAILQKGEEVLTRNDPRHILNGGGAGGSGPTVNHVKVINAIDSGSVVSEGMNTPSGTQAIINVIRANKHAVKQVLA